MAADGARGLPRQRTASAVAGGGIQPEPERRHHRQGQLSLDGGQTGPGAIGSAQLHPRGALQTEREHPEREIGPFAAGLGPQPSQGLPPGGALERQQLRMGPQQAVAGRGELRLVRRRRQGKGGDREHPGGRQPLLLEIQGIEQAQGETGIEDGPLPAREHVDRPRREALQQRVAPLVTRVPALLRQGPLEAAGGEIEPMLEQGQHRAQIGRLGQAIPPPPFEGLQHRRADAGGLGQLAQSKAVGLPGLAQRLAGPQQGVEPLLGLARCPMAVP